MNRFTAHTDSRTPVIKNFYISMHFGASRFTLEDFHLHLRSDTLLLQSVPPAVTIRGTREVSGQQTLSDKDFFYTDLMQVPDINLERRTRLTSV